MNSDSTHHTSESAWDFACRVYQKNGVADACIQLQDQHNINIPLLLFCCWAGQGYTALSPQEIQTLKQFSENYSQQTTQPLRQIRREMKQGYNSEWPITQADWEALRGQVKKLELETERVLIISLENSLKDKPVSEEVNDKERFIKMCDLVTEVFGLVGESDRKNNIQSLIELVFV